LGPNRLYSPREYLWVAMELRLKGEGIKFTLSWDKEILCPFGENPIKGGQFNRGGVTQCFFIER